MKPADSMQHPQYRLLNNVQRLRDMAGKSLDCNIVFDNDPDKFMPAKLKEVAEYFGKPALATFEIVPYCAVPKIMMDPIRYVIYHKPAVIVFWKDGTKTVVKCGENEQWDPEKGLAMVVAKKYLGNTGHYYSILKEEA